MQTDLPTEARQETYLRSRMNIKECNGEEMERRRQRAGNEEDLGKLVMVFSVLAASIQLQWKVALLSIMEGC